MATQLQIRRGTSSQVAAFTGAEGEIVVNTTNDSIVVSDGSTAGGFEMARADLNNVSDTSLNAALTGNTVSALTVTSLTSSGINVTGTVTADGLTVQTTNGLNALLESTTSYQYLQFKNSAETNNFIGFVSDDFVVSPANNQKLIVTAEGNVGIGVTPEAWTVFNPVLQIGRGAIAGSSNTNIRIFSNTYYDGAYKRIATGAVSKYEQADGNHIWYSNPSAAADSTFTPDEHMRLDPSGNVGIGVIPDGALSLESPSYTAGGIANGIRFQNGNNTADAIIQSYYSGTSSSALLHGVNSYLSTGAAFTAIDTNKPSSYFLQNTNGSFDFGSAQTGNPSSKVTIGTSGNVGIGTSSPNSVAKLQVEDITASNTSTYISVVSGNSGNAGIIFGDSDSDLRGGVLYNNADNALRFFGKNAFSEAGRFDVNGNFLVGTTSSRTGTYSLSLEASNSLAYFRAAGAGSLSQIVFARNTDGSATIAGSINTTGTTTSYNTSSDQRLKENIADADDAGSKVDAIQVRKFDWIADGSHQDYGMVAQELQTVAPEAVSAPEDPEEMMGVDYSKLVPMLVKEIQSLRARVAQLENN